MSETGRPGSFRLRLPLLDRLLDDRPEQLQDPPPSAAQALEALRMGVRRDLEALLNARRRRWPLPEGLVFLARSPLGFGIPDATAGTYVLEESREALAREVEEVIRRFEPRLQNVQVRLHDADELDRTLRLTVNAMLRTDPLPEPISFETVLEAVTRDVQVAER